MTRNNHNKAGCGFAEELVSYVYGEADAAAGAKFEAHLAGCPHCADEVEAFAGVRFSIDDWKSQEFAPLDVPEIRIPYTQPNIPKEASVSRDSWLPAFVRDFFALSPRALTLATASVAVLVAAVGFVWFSLNFKSSGDLAESGNKIKPVALPTAEKSPEQTTPNNDRKDSPVKPPAEQKPGQPEVVVEPNPKNNRAVKTADYPRQAPKPDTTNATKNNDSKRSNKKSDVIASPVVPDEDEDETLRLAELFEEIDTRD